MLSLVVNFIGLSILYLTLQAEFLAVVQVIIYAGAVLILFLFVIALLTVRRGGAARPGERLRGSGRPGMRPAAWWAFCSSQRGWSVRRERPRRPRRRPRASARQGFGLGFRARIRSLLRLRRSSCCGGGDRRGGPGGPAEKGS